MFECKVCLEKDKRITNLLDEVAYLRELANPTKLNVHIPEIQSEADQILSGADQSPSEDDEVSSERMRLLSGTY